MRLRSARAPFELVESSFLSREHLVQAGEGHLKLATHQADGRPVRSIHDRPQSPRRKETRDSPAWYYEPGPPIGLQDREKSLMMRS